MNCGLQTADNKGKMLAVSETSSNGETKDDTGATVLDCLCGHWDKISDRRCLGNILSSKRNCLDHRRDCFRRIGEKSDDRQGIQWDAV